MVNTDSHWEPPIREPLLISASKLADILDVPLWKANEIAWVLDRRFFGEGQRRYRITMASVKEYVELMEAGLPAREIMYQRLIRNDIPLDRFQNTPYHPHDFIRKRRWQRKIHYT